MTHDDYRDNIIHAAVAELGSEDWRRYVHALIPGCGRVSWCGIFALWCAHQAGVGLGYGWQLGRGIRAELPRVALSGARRGDILYMHQHQHYAIFDRIDGDRIISIDGNTAADLDGDGETDSWSCVGKRRRPASDWACAFSWSDEIDRLVGAGDSPVAPVPSLDGGAPVASTLPSTLTVPMPTSVVRTAHPGWKELQRQLARGGIYHGDIDGDPGQKTCRAIIQDWMERA